MKKEDKDLLLKDICARLSYGVIVEIISYGQETLKPWVGKLSCKDLDCFIHDVAYRSIKPYLRPMSSMTEEERKDWRGKVLMSPKTVFSDKMDILYDFCNEHHLDYRGLVEKGLALEAPEGMYTFK